VDWVLLLPLLFQMKVELGNLMKILKEAGFFSVDDDRVDWVLLMPLHFHQCTIIVLRLPLKYFKYDHIFFCRIINCFQIQLINSTK
jgi:hypothetical protein